MAGGADDFFDRLLALSHEAHGAELHEVAYHALAAALHAAQSARDHAGARRVADEARKQIVWIDTHAPEHRLSTRTAMKHDHPGVYAMLQRQAGMVAQMVARGSAEAGRE